MPDRLSQWDLDNLSSDEQSQILNYKNIWDSDPTQRDSANAAANAIRSRYGYSGAVDGGQYIPIETYQPPQAPDIPGYESPYNDILQDVLGQLQTPQEYNSPYEDLINQQISQITNRPQFSYNPEEDAAYQAFRNRALRAGDKAYEDNLGGMSAMTGGRANSWAGTVASQARNQYVMQAEEAVIQFEDRAYGRYRDETSDMYNLVNLLNSQDEIGYSRFRDQIGDTKDLAEMVLRLDDREFEQYKYMADQTWRVFEQEYSAYNDSLTFKNNQIAEAMDRANMLGYVNNKDSIVLGVPTGTLSKEARERAEAMEDYIAKSKIDIENEFKSMEETHKYDLKLLKAREESELRMRKSSGGSGGSSGGYSGSSGSKGSVNLKDAEVKHIQKEYDKVINLVESDDWRSGKLNEGQKWQRLQAILEEIVSKSEGYYGANSYQIADESLSLIMQHPEVIKIMNAYSEGVAKAQQGGIDYRIKNGNTSTGSGNSETPRINNNRNDMLK